MVLAVAFAANQWAVYALSIFIVATLITELDFLEKLAAIFWNREKYWEYRIQKAAEAEVETKRQEEVQIELSPGPAAQPSRTLTEPVPARPPVARIIQSAMSFEKFVLDAIRSGRAPFSPARTSSHVKISSDFGNGLIDAVVETPGVSFVIEIKHVRQLSGSTKILNQMHDLVLYYRSYLRERRVNDFVFPVLVVPDALEVPPALCERGVLILKFNTQSGEFTNQEQFLNAVETMKRDAV
jgi:hypothetical protein